MFVQAEVIGMAKDPYDRDDAKKDSASDKSASKSDREAKRGNEGEGSLRSESDDVSDISTAAQQADGSAAGPETS